MSRTKGTTPASPRNRAPIADVILASLKERIVSGELASGSKLPTERDLQKVYGASIPTVREALRGLSAMGLVEIRHGAGSYVTADPEALVALFMGAVIQLQRLGLAETLSGLASLDEHAAQLASQAATEADHAHLRAALAAFDDIASIGDAAKAVKTFHAAITAAAASPFLIPLCSFLTDVLVQAALELVENSIETWRPALDKLQPVRARLVQAIVDGNPVLAARYARQFHAEGLALITSFPKAEQMRVDDPKLGAFVASIMNRLARV